MKSKIFLLIAFLSIVTLSYGQEQETKVLRGKVSKVKSDKNLSFGKFYIGIFPKASAVITPLSKEWGNKTEGVGFLQGFGGELQLGFKKTEKTTIYLSAGFESWKVSRRLIANGEVLNETTSILSSVPVSIGTKFKSKNGLFLSPLLGIQKFQFDYIDLDQEKYNLGEKALPTAELRIGKQSASKWFNIEYGIHYKFVYNTGFINLKDHLHYGGLFLGISK